MTRRKRPTHHRPVTPEVRPEDYTVEGTIAQVGDFAAAVNRASGWKRALAKTLIVVLFLVPFALYILYNTSWVWR